MDRLSLADSGLSIMRRGVLSTGFGLPVALSCILISSASPASAEDDCSKTWVGCGTTQDHAYVDLMPRAEVLALEKFPGDQGGTIIDRPDNAPRYEYMSLNDCAPARPGTVTEQVTCTHALRDCPADQIGPLLRIWRRTLVGEAVTEPWSPRGYTCASDVAPGARPTLTMADLKAAFM